MVRLNVYLHDRLRARGVKVSTLTRAAVSAELENSATEAWLDGLGSRSTRARHVDVLEALDSARDEFCLN